jgi:hypothetical protein
MGNSDLALRNFALRTLSLEELLVRAELSVFSDGLFNPHIHSPQLDEFKVGLGEDTSLDGAFNLVDRKQTGAPDNQTL